MVPQVVFQVVLVLGDKFTFWAVEHLLRLDVGPGVLPELLLGHGDVLALLALVGLDLALRVDLGHPDPLLVLKVLRGQAVLVLQVLPVQLLVPGHELALDAPEVVVLVHVLVELVPVGAGVRAQVAGEL